MDYMYKYSQTWKFPEQVKIHVWYLCTGRRKIRYIMTISYFLDISKGYFPTPLAKKHKVLSGKCHGFNSIP